MSSSTTVLATAVASLFAASACSSTTPSQSGVATDGGGTTLQSVRCEGINTCKGTSECQSADGKSACQGQNECAGKGWITVPSAKECTDKGGTILVADGGGSSPRPDGSVAVFDAAFDTGIDAPTMALSVKCEGINTCAGTSECAGAEHDCSGKNSCAGKGWITVPSAGECTSKGGKVKV